MSNKRKLWQIFGPVLCAFILLLVVFLLPWERTFSKDDIFEAAASQTDTVFKGQRMKQEAYKRNYVPFYGSSELSRIDPLHPSVIAYRYHRNYMPFLLGGPGSQSLSQYFGMQGTAAELRNKKAVVIISPQWFTAHGQIPAAFSLYYSPLHACDFLLAAKNDETSRYAAKRLLQMPSATSSQIVKSGLKTIAAGQPLSKNQIFWIKQLQRTLVNEDTFFSSFQLRDRVNKIHREARKLPKNYSLKALTAVANRQGAKHTSNNDFGIKNSFFAKRLDPKTLAKLRGSQEKFNYTRSPEYADFELMLHQFAQQHTKVLFVIPPINGKWEKYTGLSHKMYEESVAKIKRQLLGQGFNNIEDLSNDGNKKYFMEDTIHLGWNGWIAVDRAVNPFMAANLEQPQYHLQDYYYSRAWQNKVGVKNTPVSNQELFRRLKRQIVRQTVAKMKLPASSVLVIKNGQKVMQESTSNQNDTSYLINSVQKPLTAAMVMRQVERGKLSLNDRIKHFYPEIAGGNTIRVRDLLNMTSGLELPRGVQIPPKFYTSDQANINRLVKKAQFAKHLYGTEKYNSLDYVLLCGILSQVTHRSYEDLFRQTYVNRLHLRHTGFLWNSPAKLKAIGWQAGHMRQKGHRNFKKRDLSKAILDAHGELGAGSVVMSASDLSKCVSAILNGTLLKKQSRDLLFKGPAPKYYGGGFYNFPKFKAANGAGEGYYTFLRTSKNGKDMMIVDSNYTIEGKFGKFRKAANKLFTEILANQK